MTVLENVQIALLSHHGRTLNVVRKVQNLFMHESMELLELVGMADQRDRACGTLAYGDLKRVELAVTLASNPKLLLMDEPTAGMGPRERSRLMELTTEIVRIRRIGVLFTEHDMEVVFTHADRIVVLSQGKLVAQGDPENVRQNVDVQEIYLGREEAVRLEKIIQPVECRIRQRILMLEVESLNTFYGKAQILFDLTLEVQTGEIVALIGRNGAGKTTLFNNIMNLVPAKSGKILFKHHSIHVCRLIKSVNRG